MKPRKGKHQWGKSLSRDARELFGPKRRTPKEKKREDREDRKP